MVRIKEVEREKQKDKRSPRSRRMQPGGRDEGSETGEEKTGHEGDESKSGKITREQQMMGGRGGETKQRLFMQRRDEQAVYSHVEVAVDKEQ